MTPLKARQERFCRRFTEFGCATTAARAAGYAPKGAKVAGYRLLRHPRIAVSTDFHDSLPHVTALRVVRPGARRAVMLEHHKRRATPPGA